MKEATEQNSNEKSVSQSYMNVKVTRDEDLFQQIGRDIYFDLVDHDKVRSLRVLKQMPFKSFKKVVAKQFGVPVQLQRFWLWEKRQNRTYRPSYPLTHQEETLNVEQLAKRQFKDQKELILYLEVDLGLGLFTIDLHSRTNEDILIFFKLYDPVKEELRYLGRLYVKASGKPVEILQKLKEMAGFATDEEITLYEEIKFEPIVTCELIYRNLTFRASQLDNGNIICFQKMLSVEKRTKCRYPDVPSFLEYVHDQGEQECGGAGQLLEEGRHGQDVFNQDQFQEIEGFSIMKKQASLYKQIWLKYGHISSSQVLTDSYSGQVALVADIMTCVMEMHNRRFVELSSSMLDSWENKLKMAEKLEFNIKWLRECFEDIKKDFYAEQKIQTLLQEQDKSLQAAKEQVMAAKDELKKAEENMFDLETRITSLIADKQMYLDKGTRQLFHGWL